MIGQDIDINEFEKVGYGMEYCGPESDHYILEHKLMKAKYRYVGLEEKIIDGQNRQVKIYRRGDNEIRLTV